MTHKLNTLPYLGDEMKPVLKELFAEYADSAILYRLWKEYETSTPFRQKFAFGTADMKTHCHKIR